MNTINLIDPDSIDLGRLQFFDFPSFLELLLRFTLNFVVILILVRWLYYSTTRRKDYLFTYILISTLIFLLCYLLASVKLQIGFALGLFAKEESPRLHVARGAGQRIRNLIQWRSFT